MISGLTSVQTVVESGAVRALLNLPAPLQRVLAGRPVKVDGATLNPEAQLLLRLQAIAPDPSVDKVSIARGRRVLDKQGRMVAGEQPIGTVRRLEVDGADGPLHARLYVPREAEADGPLLVFFHGGGWVYCSVDSYDGICRALAERSGVRVLSVDYRLAPEHPFPAAYDDALAATTWALDHAAELGADPDRIGVGGDSAGGNLAAGTALALARAGRSLKGQLLIYPATDMTRSHLSHQTLSEGFFLTNGFMELAGGSYLPEEWMRVDPRVSVLHDDDVPAALAPAYIATAGFDPLRDEGEAYARKLEQQGLEVELRVFEDQIHTFFNLVGAGHAARACNAEIADALRGLLV